MLKIPSETRIVLSDQYFITVADARIEIQKMGDISYQLPVREHTSFLKRDWRSLLGLIPQSAKGFSVANSPYIVANAARKIASFLPTVATYEVCGNAALTVLEETVSLRHMAIDIVDVSAIIPCATSNPVVSTLFSLKSHTLRSMHFVFNGETIAEF